MDQMVKHLSRLLGNWHPDLLQGIGKKCWIGKFSHAQIDTFYLRALKKEEKEGNSMEFIVRHLKERLSKSVNTERFSTPEILATRRDNVFKEVGKASKLKKFPLNAKFSNFSKLLRSEIFLKIEQKSKFKLLSVLSCNTPRYEN